VRDDFARIAATGFDSVRIFLRWEDFQPEPWHIDTAALAHLVETMEIARAASLVVMPTLFTGHMSGVNWIPGWALGDDAGDARFRVVSGGVVMGSRLASWYADASVQHAQALLAREAAHAIAGHESLLAWDLGNENSNCVVPTDRGQARQWLARMADGIHDADRRARVTIGLHMEDLEEDRHLGPREASEFCDFLTMHGYPGYASWAQSATDERVLPFLAEITRWLGRGCDVLFSEFGVPTRRSGEPASAGPDRVEEEVAEAYVARALRALAESSATGAMLWCHADYAEALAQEPPFDRAVHERSFGVFRADGEPKPVARAVQAFVEERRIVQRPDPSALHETERPAHREKEPSIAWIDADPDAFWQSPKSELVRLFGRYCEAKR
jgi:endo-1,4-beta-mannosidase